MVWDFLRRSSPRAGFCLTSCTIWHHWSPWLSGRWTFRGLFRRNQLISLGSWSRKQCQSLTVHKVEVEFPNLHHTHHSPTRNQPGPPVLAHHSIYRDSVSVPLTGAVLQEVPKHGCGYLSTQLWLELVVKTAVSDSWISHQVLMKWYSCEIAGCRAGKRYHCGKCANAQEDVDADYPIAALSKQYAFDVLEKFDQGMFQSPEQEC